MTRRFLSVLPLLAISLPLACGSDATGGAPANGGSVSVDPAETATQEAFLTALVKRQCQVLAACCTASGQKPDSAEACQTSHRIGLKHPQPNSTYIAGNAAACLTATSRQTCNGSDDEAYIACDNVFETAEKQSKSLGDPCILGSECKPVPGAIVGCFSNGTGLVCEAYSRGAAGEACGSDAPDPTQPSKGCVEGTACKDRVCKAKGALGAACDGFDFDACADGLQCRDAKCVAQPKTGEACAGADGPSCVFPATCTDGVCKEAGGEGCVAN